MRRPISSVLTAAAPFDAAQPLVGAADHGNIRPAIRADRQFLVDAVGARSSRLWAAAPSVRVRYGSALVSTQSAARSPSTLCRPQARAIAFGRQTHRVERRPRTTSMATPRRRRGRGDDGRIGRTVAERVGPRRDRLILENRRRSSANSATEPYRSAGSFFRPLPQSCRDRLAARDAGDRASSRAVRPPGGEPRSSLGAAPTVAAARLS